MKPTKIVCIFLCHEDVLTTGLGIIKFSSEVACIITVRWRLLNYSSIVNTPGGLPLLLPVPLGGGFDTLGGGFDTLGDGFDAGPLRDEIGPTEAPKDD